MESATKIEARKTAFDSAIALAHSVIRQEIGPYDAKSIVKAAQEFYNFLVGDEK